MIVLRTDARLINKRIAVEIVLFKRKSRLRIWSYEPTCEARLKRQAERV